MSDILESIPNKHIIWIDNEPFFLVDTVAEIVGEKIETVLEISVKEKGEGCFRKDDRTYIDRWLFLYFQNKHKITLSGSKKWYESGETMTITMQDWLALPETVREYFVNDTE